MIDHIKTIALEAGEIIRSAFRTDFQIEYKTNLANLVTEIDKRSEERIKSYIKKNFPAHGILAEESGAEHANAEYVWVIDPLDGTTNFAHGLPIFGVSIGVQKKGETIAGAVYHVMNDVLYFAEKGSGAYCGNERLSVNQNANLETSLLVTGFPYDIYENPYNALQIFVELVKSSRGMRRLGSASIDFCYLAQGVFEGFWEVHLQPWDICAGQLIVEEAGGMTTDFNGRKSNIFSKQILCTNGLVHKQMLKIIQSAMKP